MNSIYQTTIQNSIKFEGIGLHSGLNSEIKILPAEPNSGIVFKRVDLENGLSHKL